MKNKRLNTFYKLMLILSLPMLLATLDIALKPGYGAAHGGEPILFLFIPSVIVFFLLIVVNCTIVLFHFMKKNSLPPIKLVIAVLLFQIIHVFIFFFTNEFRQHTNLLLYEIDVVLFVFIVIYVVKFFFISVVK